MKKGIDELSDIIWGSSVKGGTWNGDKVGDFDGV